MIKKNHIFKKTKVLARRSIIKSIFDTLRPTVYN